MEKNKQINKRAIENDKEKKWNQSCYFQSKNEAKQTILIGNKKDYVMWRKTRVQTN